MKDWKEDKRWSDRFLDEIKGILGRHLIGEATEEEDAKHNTDLIVLHMEAVRIACRVRRSEYHARFGGEFTIRADRPSGVDSELSKVIAGWGQYIFYAFANEAETALDAWILGNLNVFRLWVMRHMAGHNGRMPGTHCKNGDGSSSFFSFRVDAIPSTFLVARKSLH